MLERAVAGAPDFPAALSLLAGLDLAAGECRSAELRLRQALSVQADDPELYHLLGWALYDQRRLEDAEAASRNAAERAPERADIQGQLAWFLIERGKFDAAAGVCGGLLACHPDHADGYRLMGELQFRLRRFEAAETWLNAPIARYPA